MFIDDHLHDSCHMSLQSAFGGRGDRADPSVWPEVEGPLEVISYLLRSFEKSRSLIYCMSSLLLQVILFEGWMLGFKPLPNEVVKAVDPQVIL
jgi:D-glycerate 3-kinase